MITRDGIWIGPDWLRVSRDRDVHDGVIEREQDAAPPARRTRAARGRAIASSRASSRRIARQSATPRTGSPRSRRSCRRPAPSTWTCARELDSLRARAEQRSARMQQLAGELAELEGALEVANAGNRSARTRLGEAIDAMAALEERRQVLEARARCPPPGAGGSPATGGGRSQCCARGRDPRRVPPREPRVPGRRDHAARRPDRPVRHAPGGSRDTARVRRGRRSANFA